MKTYIEEQETDFVETEIPVVKLEPSAVNNASIDISMDEHMKNSIEDRMKQNDIIKEAGSVILSTCYDTTMPVDTVVESYEETVDCASPQFTQASDPEENHIELDREDTVTVTIKNQHAVIETEIEQQPPIKKSRLWEERDAI